MPPSPHGLLCSAALTVAVLSGVAPAAATESSDVTSSSPAPAPAAHHVWADAPPTVPPTASGRPSALPEAALRAAAGDVLALRSLPGSQRTIYLDFDGGVVSGTTWNDQGVPSTGTPGWDLSGDGIAVLSTTEKNAIAEIWARVAEDFAPFDVDVTTADPGADAITRSGPLDQVYGTRVMITRDAVARSAIDMCLSTCGGVAANDTFDLPVDHAKYQPAWVFPQALSNDPKYVAEAVSHEVGHTFGLSHDDRAGDADDGYYSGHAGWAPIMGSAYAQPVTQWSRGSYAGATNKEDDLAMIAAAGAPLRADEGLTLPVPGQVSFISGPADVDVYQLRGCAGAVSVDAAVADVGPDLDVELRLLRLDESLLSVADPLSQVTGRTATGLGAMLLHTLPTEPSDYLLLVDGSGRDGTTPTTGYDDYGSVGAYRLRVAGCGIAAGSPGAPGVPSVTFSGTTATVSWTAPSATGSSPVSGYDVLVDGVKRATVTGLRTSVTGLVKGRTYQFQVAARNTAGAGVLATRTAVVPASVPGAPRIVKATSGAPGGAVTASVTWAPPLDLGGSALTQYRLTVYRLDSRGRVLDVITTAPVAASMTSAELRMPRAGLYQFAGAARNRVGWGPISAKSVKVTAR